MKSGNRDSVCSECATKMGYVLKGKQVGVWMGECDFCGKRKALTSLGHDWRKSNGK